MIDVKVQNGGGGCNNCAHTKIDWMVSQLSLVDNFSVQKILQIAEKPKHPDGSCGITLINMSDSVNFAMMMIIMMMMITQNHLSSKDAGSLASCGTQNGRIYSLPSFI